MSKTRILGLTTVLIVALLLSACASVPKPTADGSNPNHSSLYYFLSGAYSLHQSRFELSRQLLDKAQSYDPRSTQISKYLLLSTISLYANDMITKEDFDRQLSKSRQLAELDLYTLNSLYTVYNLQRDSLGLDQTLSELEKNYPSSRIHILRFYYNYNYRQTMDTKALERAERMVGTNTEDLMLLAQIYSQIDLAKALHLLDQLLDIQASPEASQMREDISKALFYSPIDEDRFNSYVYPEDKAEMQDYLDSLSLEHYHTVLLEMAETICATEDSDLMENVAIAAIINADVDVMHQINRVMDKKTGTSPQDSQIYALSIASSLAQHEQTDLSSYVSKIIGVSDMEEILIYFLMYFANVEEVSAEYLPPEIHETFHERFAKATDDEAAKDYLRAFSLALLSGTVGENLAPNKAKFCQIMIARGNGNEADFSFLGSYYYLEDNMDEALKVLRAAVTRYPDNAEFLNSLGYTLLSYPQHLEEAASLINRALAIEPDNPSYLDSLAWYYYLVKDYQTALYYMTIPLQNENIHSEVAWHIAKIYQALGQNDAALEFFKKIAAATDDANYQKLAQDELERLNPKD